MQPLAFQDTGGGGTLGAISWYSDSPCSDHPYGMSGSFSQDHRVLEGGVGSLLTLYSFS